MNPSLTLFLEKYQEIAEKWLEKGAIKEIEFSGSTYQVLVEEKPGGPSYWVFLQFEGKGELRDFFCSCEQGAPDVGCMHLATAYLGIHHSHTLPLHQRFARSLWNHLCRLFEERFGGDLSILLSEDKGYYQILSETSKRLFEVKGLSAKGIKIIEGITHKHIVETEETSLKFSNLLPEEISLWREGRPNPQLRYDLSFWSDFAKWLMQLEESGDVYKITYKHSKRGLPNWISIEFPDVMAGFYISEANLPLIIPALKNVKSALKVYNDFDEGIDRITYDKMTGVLHVEESPSLHEKRFMEKSSGGIAFAEWHYVPGEGFYTQEPHILLQTPYLDGHELSHVLTEHARSISTFLQDYSIHKEPLSVHYHLFFDVSWNLHITTYLEEPSDLTSNCNRMIGDWVFLEDDGFYPLEGKRFEECETIIPFSQVADFISQNRGWLNTVNGFRTHVRSIEYQLTYRINERNRLTFIRTLVKTKGGPRTKDFGSWVFMEGYGFYSKSAASFQYLLKPGVSLSSEQIPLFIRMNHDELTLIPNFFCFQCPISKAGVNIEITEKKRIRVSPVYHILPSFQDKKMSHFDEFIYIEDQGFFELPPQLRLPEPYQEVVELEGKEIDEFLDNKIEALNKHILKIDEKLVRPKSIQLLAKSIVEDTSKGRGWYQFELYLETEKGVISLDDLHRFLSKKQSYAFSEAGLIDLRDQQFDWIRRLNKDRFLPESNSLLISALEFMRLHAMYTIRFDEKDGTAIAIKSREILENLTQLKTPEDPNYGKLKGQLRPYQDLGIKWLWFLYRQQLSGLLCDDMGLGKTHQAMALLASVNELFLSYSEGSHHHFLIVCPTSVIYHWQEKLENFLPHLRVCTFYGTNRSLEEFHHKYDILLTSYGVLRNETELLSQVPFEIAIFDEIQVAKNHFSRVYASLKLVRAQMKLGLTGTPIENQLRELKSLFDIILPSYMPGESEYREFFVKPIEKEREVQRKMVLSKMIRPFILRRKKEDVLIDLPEKCEEVAYCDLSSIQNTLYSEVLETRRKHLIDELRDHTVPVSYLHIFSLLASLKQICDHPAVYLKVPLDYQKYTSGKWELFIELVREARESNQKVVVFSQYLGMLDIIEHYLSSQGVGFASLRGSTQNRKEQLQMFNQDPNCEVFVGSLQASGLGIDLTAGSVVIHYDRWWNAARENQATDRVHRIGQKRGVQVFKLVSKGTFEEKIDEMITRKGKLMEDVIGVDDQQLLKVFTREELLELLEAPLTSNYLEISDAE